jgi:adenylate cyclase
MATTDLALITPISRGRILRGTSAPADAGTSPADVLAWLQSDALKFTDHLELVDQTCWRLVAAGVPVSRVTLHIRTLHPQFLGVTSLWQRTTHTTEELLISHGVRETGFYLDSPMRLVFGEREAVRRHLTGPDAVLDFPMLRELRDEGLTDYLALPLPLPEGRDSAATFATAEPNGFTETQVAFLYNLATMLALHVEAHAMRLVATHILDAYLGRNAGRRVLEGRITRGSGETIRAVVWFSDMRNFTGLSDRLPPDRMIEILNAYFEAQATPIRAASGEILKFIGDGLLAIFPIEDIAFTNYTARRALSAARATLVACSRLADLPVLAGEKPLRMAIALHIGDVVFGNIGASDRLDFTAIGPAVNLVTRLEGLAKQLSHSLLVTEDFRAAYDRNLVSVGTHSLRGVSLPVQAFTVDDEESLTAYVQARAT